ncbi:MAG: flagellar assembly protein FliH [Rhodocyclaceae bacterium]|nr:flagellar assembly protein FliH [Rhodocyclaceae bacterium]
MNGQTAWERWELASFDAETSVAANGEASVVPLDRAAIERICAEAREDGYQAGYHSGYQIGKSTGYAEGQAVAQAEAARIGQAADGLEQALREFDQQVADELVALAVEIARQVVRREISARPDAILAVVGEALAQLPHQHAAIYLNPADASLVRSYLGDALAHAGHRILEEPALKPGDCLLESGGSQIDATTATRWRRVIESLGISAAWEE